MIEMLARNTRRLQQLYRHEEEEEEEVLLLLHLHQ